MPWQPPFTYPLVTRELPLDIADEMMAIFSLLGWITICESMFVRRQNSQRIDHLTADEKKDAIKARIEAIALREEALRSSHIVASDLLAALLRSEDAAM